MTPTAYEDADSTLGYATALARANSGFASRAIDSNDHTTATRAKRQTKARKLEQGAVGNNVGVKESRKYFSRQPLIAMVRSEGDRICCDFNGSECTKP